MTTLKTLKIAICLPLLLGGASMRTPVPKAPSERVTLIDSAEDMGDFYHIEGIFEVPVSRAQVWDVLTDYSALKGVVSSMQASCVLSREGSAVLVEQVALGKFLFFKKTIRLLLKIDEQPENELRFTETSGKPFKTYNGSWTLAEKGAGVEVTYRLNVSRAEMAPPFIERGLFQDNALTLLKELKAEIVRRAAQQANASLKKIPS